MSFYFSKSKFTDYCFCKKFAWLSKYKPETVISSMDTKRIEDGHLVGKLAQEKYVIDVDVTVRNKDGSLNLSQMIEQTKKYISLGKKAIGEASFSYNGIFCSVDILLNDGDGFTVIEVKSSKQQTPTKSQPLGTKEKHEIDASYQRWVLEKCGIKVNKVILLLLNKDYVLQDSFDLDKYFVEVDVTALTAEKQDFIEKTIIEAEKIMTDDNEALVDFNTNCRNCDCREYCFRNLESPSVFDIYKLQFNHAIELYNKGVSFKDVPKHCDKINETAKIQIAYSDKDIPYINKSQIQNFLSTLSYPLYFLDFETFSLVKPEIKGTGIYQAIPFQYSMHYIESERGPIKEKNFLDLSGNDPRRSLAERLVKDIPTNACILAYHVSTEQNIIKNLARLFPDLSMHLNALVGRCIDLAPVFQNGYYYVKEMKNSFSIKSVSPALFPEEREMDYHNLDGISNGSEAMSVWQRVKTMTDEEKQKVYDELITYCRLDTFAMVRIWQKLCEVSK